MYVHNTSLILFEVDIHVCLECMSEDSGPLTKTCTDHKVMKACEEVGSPSWNSTLMNAHGTVSQSTVPEFISKL